MLYRVKIDLSKSKEALNKIGMADMCIKPYWIKVDASDPDEACAKSREKVAATINKTFSSLSISSSKVEECTEEAISYMRITKIDGI